MFGRLFLSLLLVCLALPATAAMPCHDGGAMTMAIHSAPDHTAPAQRAPAIAGHVCIGCVPPSSWRAAPIVPPAPIVVLAPAASLVQLDPGSAAPPATPPPRSEA